MADIGEVQAYVDSHHKQCVEALKRIALLADVKSVEHQERFSGWYSIGVTPGGWRVAELMREIANDAIGFEHG